VKLHPIALLHKFTAGLLLVLLPLGVWGVGALALLDSALIPIPGGLDGILTIYVQANHRAFLLYCLMGAAAAAVGSLVPFYIGRAGGELFLLKRINRERYERLRDRFERQEFLAILIPSLGPPPTPLKVFQFAAGVFEMKPVPFMLATFLGKFVQFLLWSLLLIWFGPTISHTAKHAIHQHLDLVLSIAGFALLMLALYVARRIFDRRKGLMLPVEEEQEDSQQPTVNSQQKTD
jgi:membrane protein YqaA with SNARE-associated domain